MSADESSPSGQPLYILVYSGDLTTRTHISASLGSQLARDLPHHRIVEIATGPALRQYVDAKKKVDLFILDGETHPEGGMGISRELKDEVFNCPPVLLIAGRAQDAWLATWSRADDVILHPVDPFTLSEKAAQLLRSRTAAIH
jgi:DNA-binding response OmpR family regulator